MINLGEYFFTPKDVFRFLRLIYAWLNFKNAVGLAGVLVLTVIFYQGWGLSFESSVFLTYLIATLYWWIDARVALGFGIGCLVLIPVFLILNQWGVLPEGENLAEDIAVWAYYFLVIGVIRQILKLRFKERLPISPAVFGFTIVSLLITATFFKDGFIFLLDMIWAPRIQMSDYMQSIQPSLVFPVVIKALSLILPTSLIQKLILGAILTGTGFSMYRLMRGLVPDSWAAGAGLFYVLNPFVYERFVGGQWYVLLGYLYFPVIIKLFLNLLNNSGWKSFWVFTVAFSVYPIISQHWTYLAIFYLLALGACWLVVHRKETIKKYQKNIQSIVIHGLLFGLTILAVNIWWLMSFLFTRDSLVYKITLADFEAFRTQADATWGIWMNVLSLYGFWGSREYFLPKDFNDGWILISLVVVMMAGLGMIVLLRNKKALGLAMASTFLPTLVLAVGYGSEWTKPVIRILFEYLPGFAGLRDTSKLIGVLAFNYAVLIPVGFWWISVKINHNLKIHWQRMINLGLYTLMLLVIGLNSYGMGWGFTSQIEPANYPDGWTQAEKILNRDASVNRVLFLPWAGYPSLNFAGSHKVANPAKVFFSADMIAGRGLDNVYLQESEMGEWYPRMFDLLQGFTSLEESQDFLMQEGVTHILLAKTADWERYTFVTESSSVRKIFEDESVLLYVLIESGSL